MDQGWIKLHRKITESVVFKNDKCLKIWIWCLARANHSEKTFLLGRQKLTIKSGQFVMGLNKASEILDIAKTTIKYWLDFLEKEGKVELKKTTKYTIITILNWDMYQKVEHKKNSKRTQKETNKNVKNEKNVKKNINTCKQSLPVNEIMDIFYEINPTLNYANKTNRNAVEFMIKKFGLEDTKRMASMVVGIQGKDKYAPVATTPHQMKDKLSQFQIYFKNNQSKTLTV